MLDPEGHVATWNAGAERIKGYTRRRDHRPALPRLLPAGGRRGRGTPSTSSDGRCSDGRFEEEGWRVRKDGSRFWANVVITAVHDPAGEHVGFAKVTRDISERRRLEDEREDALDALAAANTELAVVNRKLQQAAEDQSQFLAVTAHELRTPVGLIKGSAHMLVGVLPTG